MSSAKPGSRMKLMYGGGVVLDGMVEVGMVIGIAVEIECIAARESVSKYTIKAYLLVRASVPTKILSLGD